MTHAEHPNLTKLLVLSTKHLDRRNSIDAFILAHKQLITPHNYECREQLSAGLQRAFALADTLGVDYIHFDDLEPPLKSLPIYD